jgi:hypothetical protein
LEKGLLGSLAKLLGKDTKDFEIVQKAGIDSSAGRRKQSYVFNYYSACTKDGKELFKIICMYVLEEDYSKAQEELAELFSKGRGDLGMIFCGGKNNVFVNPNPGYKPLLKMLGVNPKKQT